MKKNASTEKTKSFKTIIVLGAVLVVVAIIGLILFFTSRSGSEDDKTTTVASNSISVTSDATEAPTERGVPRLTLTVTSAIGSTDGQEPRVLVYENPKTGTQVLDGLLHTSTHSWNDGKGSHSETIRFPGTITITEVSEKTIDLLASYVEEGGEGRLEVKIKVRLGKEETYHAQDGQVVVLKYE